MQSFTSADKRTDYCGTLTAKDIGRKVTVTGWCQRQRDLGSLIFIDVRDRTGLLQLAFDDTTDREIRFTDGSDFSAYEGKAVRLRFRMFDAKLFSLYFA